MLPRDPTRIEKMMRLDYKNNNEEVWLTSQGSLRVLVGLLGVLLPLLLLLVTYIDARYSSPLYSISHYYFTRASSIFVIILSLLAVFLLIYKGKEPIDFYVSSIAGIFALCVVLFPTSTISEKLPDADHIYSMTVFRANTARVIFHYVSAAIFLSCLAYMAIFIFTRSDSEPRERTRNKRRRNRIYRVCGVIMLIAILIILANVLKIISDDVFTNYHITFWMETIAVESFGFAWLVKAQVFFPD